MEKENKKQCWFCYGNGMWDAPYTGPNIKYTSFCPICKPSQAEHQGLARTNLPTWLPKVWRTMEAKHYGPRFQVEPWLIVLHSGAKASGVAEFFNEHGIVKSKDGRKIKVSAHISWSKNENGFVQCVPLSHVAWHCGGSRYQGQRRLNFCSIGIELPGPWDKERDASELTKLREVLTRLRKEIPTLKVLVRHSDIDTRKKDPGPAITDKIMAVL